MGSRRYSPHGVKVEVAVWLPSLQSLLCESGGGRMGSVVATVLRCESGGGRTGLRRYSPYGVKVEVAVLDSRRYSPTVSVT